MENIDLHQIKPEELLKILSYRGDSYENRLYESILLVPTNEEHDDNGYMDIAIIGCWHEEEKLKMEICAYPDAIHHDFKEGEVPDGLYGMVIMDCFYPSGIFRYHSSGFLMGNFSVGYPTSSLTIKFIKNIK